MKSKTNLTAAYTNVDLLKNLQLQTDWIDQDSYFDIWFIIQALGYDFCSFYIIFFDYLLSLYSNYVNNNSSNNKTITTQSGQPKQ